METQSISRRRFLQLAGVGASALVGSSLNLSGRRPSLGRGVAASGSVQSFVADAEISLTALEKDVQILSGAPTHVWSYYGELLSGSGATVQNIEGSYLGPIIRAESGKNLRIFLHNGLTEDTVLHPHGLRVPEDCDGQPMQAIGPGETKIYEFQVIDQASPAWFHPHPMMRTAEQVAFGMAGLFYVWDQTEEAAVPGASTGANDVPLVIQDRLFDSNNQILYQDNIMWGYLGDRILVNGKLNATLPLEPRAYRLRCINGSNARTYKLAWSNGMPLKVIGTDGGLLPEVATRPYVTLMPGERVDLWADFSGLARKQVKLRSLSFTPGCGGGGGGGGCGGCGGGGGGGGCGGMGGGMVDGRGGGMMPGLANGAAFDILTVNVGRRASRRPVLGPLPPLSVIYDASNVPNYYNPVPFTLACQHMIWTLNGRVYVEGEVLEDEMVCRDMPIAWQWINSSPIPHPMHIHNCQFQVVERDTTSVPSGYSTINQGLVDGGWKDTVLVWPGERVKVAMTFGPHSGMYMYHCHILEHEDMGMMRNLMIMEPDPETGECMMP